MRISLESHDGIRWALSVSDRPTPADQVVSERDVDVLMDPDAASALDDKVLDACVEGGRIQFLVEKQGEADTPRARPRDRARLGGQPDEDRAPSKD
ncbi:MAG: Fe-S cluster assembly protein HesB [Actinomycetota bacterium]|nr:Fe-S cluster assembly protein HesB [Actinomycetota bacterium]